MKSKHLMCIALAGVALFAGCATQRGLIEKRIGEKAQFFAALPPEKQQQLREGRLCAGDVPDAAWIVYGNPDRKFQRVTGTTTNEVWSYISYDATFVDSPRAVYHPVFLSHGRAIWHRETIWATDVYHNPYEYLRIEFQDGRVLSFEAEKH